MIADFPLRVASSSAGLLIRMEPDDRAPVEYHQAWPDAFQGILDVGAPCPMGVQMLLTVADDAITGADSAVALRMLGSSCGP